MSELSDIFVQGIQFLTDTRFIGSRFPRHITKSLLESDRLTKAMIGEYLGKG